MNYKFIILVLFLCTLSTFVFSVKKKPVVKPIVEQSTKPLTVLLLDIKNKKKIYTMGKGKTGRHGTFYFRGEVKYSLNYEPNLKFTYKCFQKSPKKTACINKKNFNYPEPDIIERKNETIHLYFLNDIEVYEDFKYRKYKC
uniref:Uncharacterized protein n=2 Tax=Strongyloides stercoralis TaxID=6248 RepID=A0AAF5I324_STRER